MIPRASDSSMYRSRLKCQRHCRRLRMQRQRWAWGNQRPICPPVSRWNRRIRQPSLQMYPSCHRPWGNRITPSEVGHRNDNDDAYLYSSADGQFARPTPPTDGRRTVMWRVLPSFESTRDICGLLASTHLCLGLLSCCPLLTSLSWHSGSTRAWSDGKTFAGKP